MALIGTETLQVLGADANGYPAGPTQQTTTGAIAALSSANPKVYSVVGGTATAVIGGKYLLNTASGSVLTLPAATGTGGTIDVVVTTTVTSNSHKILAASSSDNMQGLVITQKTGTATAWPALISSTFHSLQ